MVFKSDSFPWPLYSAHRQAAYTKLPLKPRLDRVFKDGFDCLVMPLFEDAYILDIINKQIPTSAEQPLLDLDQSSLHTDEELQSRSLLKNIMLEVNSCVQLETPIGIQVFEFIVGYAAYLGSYALLVHLPPQQAHRQLLVSQINSMAQARKFARMHIILNVDLSKGLAAWQQYVDARSKITSHVPVDLMLSFSDTVPTQNQLTRWIGERVDYLNLSSKTFVNNNKGFPVLHSKTQGLVRQLFRHKAKLVISSDSDISQQQLKFVQFLFQKCAKPTQKEAAAMTMYDVLQTPLQPYYDNLQSDTYYVFETDNAKYDEYEMSLYQAFNTFPANQKIIIYYIGSGRGQLLYSAFNASKKANRKIFVYAIEKNPYPLQALKKRIKENKWGNYVQIVYTDIKAWVPPEPADIFLSELLGGFGDNQLSPECLYWAEKHLVKGKTMCIPKEYSSYITPISCSSLYRQLGAQQLQNYYVVNLHNYSHPLPQHIEKCWTFHHPTPEGEDFCRKHKCVFKFEQTDLVHGLAGYFSCELFGSSRYSTHPHQHTPDMYSWFPMYFAFRSVLKVHKNDELRIEMRRGSDEKKVWYQWDYQLFRNGDKIAAAKHNQSGLVHAIYK